MNVIEIKGLCKNYPDFTLDHLDLTLPGGCIMGLVGENGAGKSTTIKLILNILRRDGGTIRLFGQEIGSGLEMKKEELGVVLDEVGIPECLNAKQVGKVMANTYHNWDAQIYEQYLKELKVPEDKPFAKYSRGMKMKLGIAVALSHHPKLLILDEATSGLDPVVRDKVIDIVSEFTREEDHAVLMSSHIVSDLEKVCDYIAFLHKGKLLLCEEKDRLMEEYGVLRCGREQAAELMPGAIVGKRVSDYGVEAVVRRDMVPAGMEVGAVSVEDIFVFMAKEE